jgi:CheY-like chemotaxis protein
MKKKPMCIMLIDDNENDNFFHEREIKKNSFETVVITKESGIEALEYLRSIPETKETKPDLIFLDINMPGMNGWEFLAEYNQLGKEIQSQLMIIMLTTSDNSKDKARALAWDWISDFITKPLTKEIMEGIYRKYIQLNLP